MTGYPPALPRRVRLEPARRALHTMMVDFERSHPVSVLDMIELLAERQAELIDFAQRRPRLAHQRPTEGP